MKRSPKPVACATAALLALGGCGLFDKPPFEPTGTEWDPGTGVFVVSVTGSDSVTAWGSSALELTLKSEGGGVVDVPGGLFFFSADDVHEDVISIEPRLRDLVPGVETTLLVDCFSIERDRAAPERAAGYEVGPVTDNRSLDRVVELLCGREYNRPSAVDSIQQLIWEIVDENSLSRDWVEWIESLPGGG